MQTTPASGHKPPQAPPQTASVTLLEIQQAAERLRPFIHRTPLFTCQTLNARTGAQLFLKGEHLQKSGSFKIRGALNTLLQLSEDARRQGVVAFSSGNHAQGVAMAARLLGMKATIVMPADAPRVKLDATAEYGAQVVLYDRVFQDREAMAKAIALEQGATLVPPFDHPHVIAGQGTIGLEIAEDLPELDLAVLPVGGGGLISGIAIALKALQPQVKVIGVEPESADDARQSLEQDRIVKISQPNTIADGVATTAIGQHTFAIMREQVDSIVTVKETEIREALWLLLTRTKQLVEPTGALSTAAILTGQVPTQGKRVLSLLCGGNLDPRSLASLLEAVSA